MRNIAIDGPAGVGKSTVAKILAKNLNMLHVDTGAMYRAVGLYALKNGIDTKDEENISKSLQNMKIEIKLIENEQHVFLNDQDITSELRTNEVSMAASDVSSILEVRKKLVSIQQEIAKNGNVVMEGRDIGTCVLTDAEIKIYLTASVKERAKRRYNEIVKRGESLISIEELERDLITRDTNDSTREHAPLKPADDSIIFDTTGRSIEEVAKEIMSFV